MGLKIARGEYIGFVDADDWVDLDFFEKLYNATNNGIYDIACTNIISYPDNKKFVMYHKTKVSYGLQEKANAAHFPKCFSIWNKIYKAAKLKSQNISFVEGRYYEDIVFLIEVITKMDSIINLSSNGPRYYYNKLNSLSTTKQKSQKHIGDHVWAMTYFNKLCDKYNIKVNNNYSSYVKFLGIEFLKIHHELDRVNYKLFNFIPVLTIYKK